MLAASGDDWLGLDDVALPVEQALAWAVLPSCGAVVLFVGTVRDHAEGRDGVTGLTYEAYDQQATRRMAVVAADVRERWPEIGRIALLHRVGRLAVTDTAVAVVVSAPHREGAFAAARHAIDALKATVPIWKKEAWSGGEDWGTRAQPLDATMVEQ